MGQIGFTPFRFWSQLLGKTITHKRKIPFQKPSFPEILSEKRKSNRIWKDDHCDFHKTLLKDIKSQFTRIGLRLNNNRVMHLEEGENHVRKY
jgi:hypothetical protein